jgi:hypothetical protein
MKAIARGIMVATTMLATSAGTRFARA